MPPTNKKAVLKKADLADIIDPLVPEPEVAERYVNRTISGKLSDFDVFDFARNSKANVLLEGPTGPGKTTAIKAYASARRLPFFRVPSSVSTDPSQFFGKYVPDGKGGFRWEDGPVTKMCKTGGVLLINEINFLPARVASVLFGLLDSSREVVLLDHENEVVKAVDGLVIFADMNPDYEGTRVLNAALRNRFSIQLDWGYDPTVEESLIVSPALREMLGQLRTAAAQGAYFTPISTNMGMEFVKHCEGLGFDFATTMFVNHFTVDEREAVRKVIEAHSERIIPEMPRTDETEEEAFLRRANMKVGDFDPEYGVLGTDWVWNEEDEEF